MEMEGAMPPASPIATDIRASNNCQNCAAMPHARVAKLHKPQHTATMLRRL